MLEVNLLPQVGFLVGDAYEYHLLDDIPMLADLEARGFRLDRPRAIRGLAVDVEELTRRLAERNIPFRFTGFDEPGEPPETMLCEFEGTIDHVIRRAFAKISFNYLAYWQGPGFVHRPEFDMARAYIRHGTMPDYPMMRLDEKAILEAEPIEGPRLVCHLVTTNWTEVNSVVAQVTLYNWMTYWVSLSKEFVGPRPEIRRGHLFDVENRRIHELGSRLRL